MKARGLRNNNPANIRLGSQWLGMCKEQTDKSFCQFDSMDYGIRAFLVLMRTYYYVHKLDTIEKILHRFAPLSENNTHAYIAFVEKYMYEHQKRFILDGVEYKKRIFHGSSKVNIWHNNKKPFYRVALFTQAVLKMESGRDFALEEINKAIELL